MLQNDFFEKGENAGNQHFLLFPQFCLTFSELFFFLTFRLFPTSNFNSDWFSKVCSWIKVENLLPCQLFTTQSRILTTLKKKPLENIVGKGENAGNQHFLLFTQCFLLFLKQISIFDSHLSLLSANASSLDQSKDFVVWYRV